MATMSESAFDQLACDHTSWVTMNDAGWSCAECGARMVPTWTRSPTDPRVGLIAIDYTSGKVLIEGQDVSHLVQNVDVQRRAPNDPPTVVLALRADRIEVER